MSRCRKPLFSITSWSDGCIAVDTMYYSTVSSSLHMPVIHMHIVTQLIGSNT